MFCREKTEKLGLASLIFSLLAVELCRANYRVQRHINPAHVIVERDTPRFEPYKENCYNSTALQQILLYGSGYNKNKIPRNVHDPNAGVRVDIEIWIQEITTVSETTNDFEMDIYINEVWHDPELKFAHLDPCAENLTLSSDSLEHLWFPNSCFINSKVGIIHDSPFRNVFIMIQPNGSVLLNYRLKVRGPCEMDLRKFPMDTQTCNLVFVSFSYNNDEVQMRWTRLVAEPVVTIKKVILPDYDLLEDEIETKLIPLLYPAGYWDELHLFLTFKRRVVWYILQSYIPMYLTVFTSWIAFVIDPNVMPARMLLGVNSVLALVLLYGRISKLLPAVSYVKAIDIFTLSCLTFVFSSLIESAFIGYLISLPVPDTDHKNPAKKKKSSKKNRVLGANTGNGNGKDGGYGLPMTVLHSHSTAPLTEHKVDNSDDMGIMRDTGHNGLSDNVDGVGISQACDGTQSEDDSDFEEQQCTDACLGKLRELTKKIDRVAIVFYPFSFAIFNTIYWIYYTQYA